MDLTLTIVEFRDWFANCYVHATSGLASLGSSAPILGGVGIGRVDLMALHFGDRQSYDKLSSSTTKIGIF